MDILIFWDAGAPGGFQLPVLRTLGDIFGYEIAMEVSPIRLNGYNRERRQYNAGSILDNMDIYRDRMGIKELILLVIDRDLYTAGRPFVFGLARPSVGVAVVSSARLKNEWYRLPPDDNQLTRRLSREGAHECGHLLGLSHCMNSRCIMFNPATLSDLDRKEMFFCQSCRNRLDGSQYF